MPMANKLLGGLMGIGSSNDINDNGFSAIKILGKIGHPHIVRFLGLVNPWL